MNCSPKTVETITLHQLRRMWPDIDEQAIVSAIPAALDAIEKGFTGLPGKRFFDGREVVFSPYVSVQWMIFLYRLSRALFLDGKRTAADQVYYLNKALHANDWLYEISLPVHFLCEHPLGSVLGRATYGDYLVVYQGTTIGGNRTDGKLAYPVIGGNVILYANATVLGDSHIGNNVAISAGTYLLNETVPDNCIVFGTSPHVTFKRKRQEEIRQLTQHIWGW